MRLLKNLTFRSKILAMLLLTTLLLSSYSFVLISSIDEVNQVSNEIQHNNIPELTWISYWEKELSNKEHMIESYIANGYCCYFIENYESFLENSKEHTRQELTSVPASLEHVKREIDLLDFMVMNNVNGLLAIEDLAATKNFLKERYLPKLHDIKQELDKAEGNVFSSLNSHSSHFSSIISEALVLLVLLTSGAMIISGVAAYRISANLTQPVQKMIDKVDRISKGEYGLKVDGTQQVELQQLTQSINQMSSRLKDSFHTILNDKIYREQILNSLPVGVITIDEKTAEVSLNYSAKQLLGDEYDKAKKDSLSNNENQLFWGVLTSKEISHNLKVPFQSKEGSHALLISQAELMNQRQEVIGRIVYFIDITETEELEKRMHHSEKLALVGELAAGAAHEIRNPLAVIDGFLSIMNHSFTEEDKQKFYVPLLLMELKRINSIIEEMLMLTKPSAPILKKVYLEDIFNEILPLIEQSSVNELIEFQMNLERVALFIDEKQLKQVFYNVIRNSVEAMDGKGCISIYSKIKDGFYQIFLEDTGSGIPEVLQSSIFDPFLTSKESGTGLGLTIVERIIDNHHGVIKLVSSCETGTVFMIKLPLDN
ncbi:sensor histidine kinase [Bacillus solitudinis]|uniref:sensor histidine kinase n=1 Tax=Bacillus solitudinis TaxID=2014074 RepID=UPI001D0D17AC|nr:ATP-binding protein [Bacillus solitudinis]